ncbi:MAG: hypothetical protein ACXVGC_12440 [Mycobacteriaceae bacterium]
MMRPAGTGTGTGTGTTDGETNPGVTGPAGVGTGTTGGETTPGVTRPAAVGTGTGTAGGETTPARRMAASGCCWAVSGTGPQLDHGEAAPGWWRR